MPEVSESEARRMIEDAMAPLVRENAELHRRLGHCTAEEYYGAQDALADVLVGPKLAKGTTDKKTRKAREAARVVFALGRQPFREGLIEWPR